jgi:predicted ATP-grasp superfamily ATP-dependent carboligase
VDAPHTEVPRSAEEIPELKDEFSYPVLIKPQYTTVRTEDGTYIESKISETNYVHDPDQLVDSYRSFLEKHPYFDSDLPLIQEVIPGAVMATCGVAEDGEFVEYFQEERLRMFPVDGGASALRHGICDSKMAEDAKEIVAALEWTGPIYIEFIRSSEGDCHVLEVNGRYWGSVGCAIRGGVNVPLLHYRQMKGISSPPDRSRTYRLGCKQRRLFYTDIRWLIAQLNSGNVDALVPFVRSFFDADHDLLSADDPLPAAGAILWAAQEIVQRKGPTDSLMDEVSGLTDKVFGFPREIRE